MNLKNIMPCVDNCYDKNKVWKGSEGGVMWGTGGYNFK